MKNHAISQILNRYVRCNITYISFRGFYCNLSIVIQVIALLFTEYTVYLVYMNIESLTIMHSFKTLNFRMPLRVHNVTIFQSN